MGYIFKFLAFNIGQYIGISLTISDLTIYFVMAYIVIHIINNNKINDKEKRNFYINLLPILGVIGTFAGICIGLADFNSNEIEKSVPLLLQGLKTAFWTSLIGTSLAVFFNVWYSFKDKKDLDDEDEEVPLLKLQIKELQEISKKFNNFLENQLINNKNLKELELIKDELKILNKSQEQNNTFYENSLLKLEILEDINKKYDKNNEQLLICTNNITDLKDYIALNLEETKKLNATYSDTFNKLNSLEEINTDIFNKNSEISENSELLLEDLKDYKNLFSNFSEESKNQSKELITAFKEFATYMAEENSKAFIEALNKTIRDFNNNLIESFGSNFKQLNEAVIKLVDWQEQYKQIIEATTENQKVIFDSFNGIEKELQTFTSETKNVNSIVSELSTLTKESMEQNIKLNETLNVFSELNSQAKELIPNLIEINNNVDNNIKTFSNYSNELISNLDSFTNNLQTNFSQYIDDINKGVKGSTDNIIGIMEDSIKKIETNFDKSLENTDLKLKETSENIFVGIEKFNLDFSNNMKEQLDKFINNNENYSNEINKLLKNTIETIEDNERNNSRIIEENIKQIEKLNNTLSNVLKEHVDNIEKELAESLNTSLNSLGEVMAKISDRFAKDYGPLADKLKEIVELPNKRVR